MAGDGHGLVEGRDVEGNGPGEDGDALADLGVLDEEVLGEGAEPAAAADDAGGGGLGVDHHAVARLQVLDLGADLDDLPRGFVTEGDGDHGAVRAEGRAADVQEEGVGSTDATGADAHEDVLGTGYRALDLDDVDGVHGAGLYGLHGGHGGIRFLKTLRRLLASGSDEP